MLDLYPDVSKKTTEGHTSQFSHIVCHAWQVDNLAAVISTTEHVHIGGKDNMST